MYMQLAATYDFTNFYVYSLYFENRMTNKMIFNVVFIEYLQNKSVLKAQPLSIDLCKVAKSTFVFLLSTITKLFVMAQRH
ncbi:hypothetical protein QTP88_024544 [Uroleucon formosanum]